MCLIVFSHLIIMVAYCLLTWRTSLIEKAELNCLFFLLITYILFSFVILGHRVTTERGFDGIGGSRIGV